MKNKKYYCEECGEVAFKTDKSIERNVHIYHARCAGRDRLVENECLSCGTEASYLFWQVGRNKLHSCVTCVPCGNVKFCGETGVTVMGMQDRISKFFEKSEHTKTMLAKKQREMNKLKKSRYYSKKTQRRAWR